MHVRTNANPEYYSRGAPSFSSSYKSNYHFENKHKPKYQNNNKQISFANINSNWNKENKLIQIQKKNYPSQEYSEIKDNKKSYFEKTHYV